MSMPLHVVIILTALLFSTLSGFGQDKRYPVQFNPLLLKNYSLINPASTNTDSRFEVNTANITTLGIFEGLNSFFINAAVSLNNDSTSLNRFNKNVVGITFYNEREGPYIHKNQGYIMYARHQRLGYRFSVGVGTSFGFLGYAFDSTRTTAGGSDYDMDANVGIWIYSENFRGGLSINQIMNNDIQPLGYTYIFARYYNLNAAQKIILSQDLYVQPSFQIRWQGLRPQWIDIGSLVVIGNRLMAGINYKHKHSFSYMAGVNNISISKGKVRFNFCFSYQSLLNRAGLGNLRSMEIALNFMLN
jgi:type IX secretion system PorP/SprF family membrane protein